MNDNFCPKVSPEGIHYLDLSGFMTIPCGTITRNESFSLAELQNFILKIVQSDNTASQKYMRLIQLNQKHTNIIIKADSNHDKPADGVYSDSRDDILIIKTADCFPVFLYDGRTCGLIHVGWRGAFAGIIGNFLEQAGNFNPTKAKAAIGPGIESCCFEVSPEVALLFDSKYRHQKKDCFFIDLRGFIIDELTKIGVKCVVSCEACTACKPNWFYSYRREGKKDKQMLSYICSGGK
ncbi:MAG: polyphenol oxidase family protein [candidate division Zixibacteria bacterium]|nr:polyphenol oxidase family protein [candidate division Zixibacteria bacterium]